MVMAAQTPEELETLLEDASVRLDFEGMAMLFAPYGVLAGPSGSAQGPAQIARSARTLISGGWSYVAEPKLVLQAKRTALVIGPHAVNVARRGRHGVWRYEICRLGETVGLRARPAATTDARP